MDAVEKNSKFYVVGGPVQPDRDCYVSRDADDILLRRLLDGDYCHVMGRRHIGKTSLAAHTAWNLRDRDVRVAVVDLTQLKVDDPDQSAGRWYYSIAYRIVRDLRLKSDMQTWWSEHSGLPHAQRFVEFFFEVVLAQTDHRYVIFIDRLEAIAGQPLADEFLGAVRACYDARANESEFQRLTFCLLGTGIHDEIVSNVQDSPFGISANVHLGDFRRSEINVLAQGLRQSGVDVEQVISRVWWWTRGHPYLSQKVFRGLSRRNDDLLNADTVDDLINNQFLSSSAPEDEAHLSFIRKRLLRNNATRVARLSLYGRLLKGGDVAIQYNSKVQQELFAAGVVSEGVDGQLKVRNHIYAEVFNARWVNQNLPFGWKRLGVAVVLLALLIALPVWYTKYLPRPYVRALTSASQDFQVAQDAYESLSMLPGYSDRANTLFTDFLLRQSGQATTLVEAMRTHKRLLQLPGTTESAGEALANFWDRHSNALALRGERDGALLAQLNALDVPTEERRRKASALIGTDYTRLIGTIRVQGNVRAVKADAEASRLVLLDDQHMAHVWQLNGDRAPQKIDSIELAAEERLQVTEKRILSAPPSPLSLDLLVATDHSRPADVQVVLRAPSGAEAVLSLSDAQAKNGTYRFASARFPALASLLGDDASGTWQASFSDTERGVTGFLLDWSINIPGGSVTRVEDSDPVLIPEPVLTTLVASSLNESGRQALVWPEDESVSGDMLIWDLPSATVLRRIPRAKGLSNARFALGGSVVLARYPRRLEVWDAASGNRAGQIPLVTTGQPVLSANGRFLVTMVERQDGSNGFQVWDIATMEPVGAVVSAENARTVAVDGLGYYLAIGGADELVRIWSLRDATLFREFGQAGLSRRLAFDALGRWLVSEDQAFDLRVWEVAGDRNYPVLERAGSRPWEFAFDRDGQQMIVGSGSRTYDVVGLSQGRVAGSGYRHPSRQDSNVASPGPLLLSENNLVLTHDGRREVKLWRAQTASFPDEPAAEIPATVSQGALSTAGDKFALGTVAGQVRVLGVDGDSVLIVPTDTEEQVSLHSSAVHRIVFNADGSLLASGSATGEVRITDAVTAVPAEFSVRHPDGAIFDLAFAEDDSVLVSASTGLVFVTDTATGERIAEFRVQGGEPQLSVPPSGDILLISTLQGGVTAWNWRAGSQEQLVPGDLRVVHAAFANDARYIVIATASGDILLWDRQTREQVGEAITAPGNVDELWTWPDNTILVVRSGTWILGYSMGPEGLQAHRSLLLPESTAAVQPDPEQRIALALTQVRSSRPSVVTMSLDAAQFEPLQGDVADLQSEWRERLAYDDVFAQQAGGL